MDAVEILTGKESGKIGRRHRKKKKKMSLKVLRLPEKYQDSKRVIQYTF